jgi:site-specific DNA-cytosine methylase
MCEPPFPSRWHSEPGTHLISRLGCFVSAAWRATYYIQDELRGSTSGSWSFALQKLRVDKGLVTRPGAMWSARKKLTMVSKTNRNIQMIDTVWDFHCTETANPEHVADQLWQDLSQNLSQQCGAYRTVPTQTTSMELYHYGQDRVLAPCEYWFLHGFPQLTFDDITPKESSNLVGESFALPVVTLVSSSILIHLQVNDLWTAA